MGNHQSITKWFGYEKKIRISKKNFKPISVKRERGREEGKKNKNIEKLNKETKLDPNSWINFEKKNSKQSVDVIVVNKKKKNQ